MNQHGAAPFPRTNRLTTIGRYLQRIEEWILAAAVMVIAGLTITNVICRSVFGFSLAVTEEVSQFCMIVLCFVGLSYAASRGRHIRMTAIYDQLSYRCRKTLMVFITTSTALLMFTLAYYAGRYVHAVFELGGVYPALRIPFYFVYAIAPIGLSLAGIQYSLAALRNLTSPGIYVAFDVLDRDELLIQEEV